MDSEIQAALDNPVVYTDEYKELLARLSVEISEVLGREVAFKYEDCYTPAFVTCTGFSPAGVPLDPDEDEHDHPKPWYQIRFHVSPRGPFFTYDAWQAQIPESGPGSLFLMPWDSSKLPVEIQAFIEKVAAKIAGKGYTFLTRKQCGELVPGKGRQYDRHYPATVGSELFTEF